MEDNMFSDWEKYYVRYKFLKKMLSKLEIVKTATGLEYGGLGERVVSMTMKNDIEEKVEFQGRTITESDFFMEVEKDMKTVDEFTMKQTKDLLNRVKTLEANLGSEVGANIEENLKEAEMLASVFMKIEKYVNQNCVAFHKILKKHDKTLPSTPCRAFYIKKLHQQQWIKNDFSSIFVRISRVLSSLRKDGAGIKDEGAAQEFVRKTTKYWIRTDDITKVKYAVLKHLPVFQFDEKVLEKSDSQLTNSVYLDNVDMELYKGRINKKMDALAIRLRWYGTGEPKLVFVERKTHRDSWTGEESVKERFTLPPSKVVPYLRGKYRIKEAIKDMNAKGQKSKEEIQSFRKLFTEIQNSIESKLLQPTMRTQYMRVAYQIPFNPTVRVSLDTNLNMMCENAEASDMTCLESGRWFRDPSIPLPPTEVTRFPHAVLEIKLALKEGDEPPEWVTDLMESKFLTEVHKFSKFLHGCATLLESEVDEVPYWMDDNSIAASILRSHRSTTNNNSATNSRNNTPPRARNSNALTSISSTRSSLETPLLMANGSGAQLMDAQPYVRNVPGGNINSGMVYHTLNEENDGILATKNYDNVPWCAPICCCFVKKNNLNGRKPRKIPMKVEPKTYFANERTFLSWLHMAVTLGSIGGALIGFKDLSHTASTPRKSLNTQIVGMVMSFVALIFCIYALRLYFWRSEAIRTKQVGTYDDRYGPAFLAFALICAFGFIFGVNLYNF